MKRLLLVIALLLLVSPAQAYRAVTSCPGTVNLWTAGSGGVDVVVDLKGNVCISGPEFPAGATPVTNSGTGQTATLAAAAGQTTYICGFSARSNATAAVQGNLTIAGTISGTMNFAHVTTVLGTITPTEQYFYPCIPGSAVNTAIVITAPAPGAGGVASTTAWGYQK